jgi:major membrane immunogen (membrane-anchored lipoprotein)
MKNAIISGVIAATILLTGCGKKSGISGNFDPQFAEEVKK